LTSVANRFALSKAASCSGILSPTLRLGQARCPRPSNVVELPFCARAEALHLALELGWNPAAARRAAAPSVTG